MKKWAAEHSTALTTLAERGRFNREQCLLMQKQLALVENMALVLLKGGQRHSISGLAPVKGASLPMFLQIEPPGKTEAGTTYAFNVRLVTRGEKQPPGGCSYLIQMLPHAKGKAERAS